LSQTDAILKKVRHLEIKSKGLSRHLFSGEYQSAFKGKGMSFSEVRSYQYGDDVRNLDWNVTARTGAAHVKVFEEERELTLMLLVDVSASALFGTQNTFKRDIMAEISAVLAFSANQNNDKVGLLLFSDQVEMYVPPKKGKAHILYLLKTLIRYESQNKKTDLNVALEYFSNIQKKRSICFLLSDFVSPDYQKSLSVNAKKHDIIGIKINDPAEKTLPTVGLLKVQDPETQQELWIDSDNAYIRQQYTQLFDNQEKTFEQCFAKSGSDSIKMQTTQSYIHTLLDFFKRR
jgi:uncharacterized protein (DUF58 family)